MAKKYYKKKPNKKATKSEAPKLPSLKEQYAELDKYPMDKVSFPPKRGETQVTEGPQSVFKQPDSTVSESPRFTAEKTEATVVEAAGQTGLEDKGFREIFTEFVSIARTIQSDVNEIKDRVTGGG